MMGNSLNMEMQASDRQTTSKELPATNRIHWTRLVWASYVTTGVSSALSGSVLPEVITDYRLSPLWGGIFIAAPAIGVIISGLAGGLLSGTLGLKRLLIYSLVCLTASVICIAYAQAFILLLIGAAAFGFGHGLVEICGNAVIVEFYPNRSAQELNRLHLFFGVGSLTGPAIVALMLTRGLSWRLNYGLVAVLMIALAAVVSRQTGLPQKTDQRPDFLVIWSALRQPAIFLIWASAAFLLATEQGVTGWVTTYLRQKGVLSPQLSSLGLTIFWAAVLAGRLVNSYLPESINYTHTILVEVGSGVCALLLVLVAPFHQLSLAGLGLLGFSIAGLYPAILASANRRHPQQKNIINGLFVSGIGFGKLVGPASLGLLANLGGLSRAMYAILITFLGTAIVHLLGQSIRISEEGHGDHGKVTG